MYVYANIYIHISIFKKISFGGIPNSRNVLFLQIFLKRAAKPSTGNTSAGFPWTKWPQILLNLTWLCTKASRNLLQNLLRKLVEPDMAFTKASRWTWPDSAPKPPTPSPEPSRNPVEPGLALHQSLSDLLRNLRNSLEPRWTWPGPCTSAHRSYSGLKTPLAYAVGEKSYSTDWQTLIDFDELWRYCSFHLAASRHYNRQHPSPVPCSSYLDFIRAQLTSWTRQSSSHRHWGILPS